jgi:hypothetical protein
MILVLSEEVDRLMQGEAAVGTAAATGVVAE